MLVSFLESIRYVNHLYPLVLLRLYLGINYFSHGLDKYQGDYLLQPRLASAITEHTINSGAPTFYRHFLEDIVVPHWQIFAYGLMYCEGLIGLCLILGFLARPVSLLGFFIALNFIYISPAEAEPLYRLQMVVFLVLAWFGAGRCLGFDFFFYKRQRGWLW